MTAVDATRLAGEAYCPRLARGEAATPDDKTRLAQEGYQSRLARDAANVQPDTSEFYKVGEKIGGRYEVAAIHHGELGVVYGCFDHQTKLARALKTVRARHARDKQVLLLFESEATVWISLEKHPYIVRAYLVERFNDLPYVITEYVRGPEGMEGDLRGWLGHPRMTLPVAVAMALQIAQGMQHAVRKVSNLVHRDLKPGNILVNVDGKAMVTDFGLVHAAQSGAGTPAYMSPEQWRTEALDARSDIYAYGCILFEMFTAHRLFPALTEWDWQSAHLESAPAALTSIVRELPDEIDRFVRRCLEKDPAARPQSWDEIVVFFAEWYHRLTGKAVVLDFSSLELDATELFNAAYSLWNLKRYEECLIASDRALAIDHNHPDAEAFRGLVVLTFDGHEEEWIQACNRVLAAGQGHANTWFINGTALRNLKRYEEAIQAFNQVLDIDKTDCEASREKGKTLCCLERYEEAIQTYDRALTIHPKHSTLLASIRRDRAIALQLSTLSEGATVKGIVKIITDYGVVVDLGGIDGLLHISDLAWRRVKHPSEVLALGDEITAQVLKFDAEKNRVSLGLKQLGEDPFTNFVAMYDKGKIVPATVKSVDAKGAVIALNSEVEGYLRASEVSRDRVEDARTRLNEGDSVSVMIINIDRKNRTINLSIRAKDMADEAVAIMAKIQSDSAASTGSTNLDSLLKAKLDNKNTQPQSFWARLWGK